MVRVNLTGTFLMCRAVVPVMKKQGKGKIVNMASLGGRTGRPGVGVNYAASKAGVIGLTQTLAREAGPAGIYVNAIAPGPILTELTKQVGPEVFSKWNVGRAVTKDGLPEDVAEAALFRPRTSRTGLRESRWTSMAGSSSAEAQTQGGAMSSVKVVSIKDVPGD